MEGKKMYNRTAMAVMHMSFWLFCVAIVVALAMSGCGIINPDDKPEISRNSAVIKGRVISFTDEDSARTTPIPVDGALIFITDDFQNPVATTDEDGRYSFQLLLEMRTPLLDIMVYAWKEGYRKSLRKDNPWAIYGPAMLGVWPSEAQIDIVLE
jgi:uncharacterized protein YceK